MRLVGLRVIVLASLGLLVAEARSFAQQGSAPAPPPATPPSSTPSSPAPGAGQDPQQPPPPATPPAGSQAPAGSSKVFNPDISVIGNFLGVAGKNPNSDQPSMQMSEVEVAFQAPVDPYARADFFLSATPEGLDVEEGYLTFTTLPAGLLLKVGKMRGSFGKINTMHTHILPWADRPLVHQNLLGGEEGLSDTGASLSKLIPNDVLYLEATGEVLAGNNPVFKSEDRSKLNYIGRLRGYRDLSEGANLDVGTSFSHGPSADMPDFNKQLFGVDATFRYRPLRRAIYHRFIARTEMIWSRQDLPNDLTSKAFGFFSSADYQFAQRWYIGARADRSGRVLAADLHDNGFSAYLTFWPSEFSQLRAQYRRTNYAESVHANEVLFQANFSIGAHGAHSF